MPAEPRSPREMSPDRCSSCGDGRVTRDRVVMARKIPVIEAIACPACGDWWFETCGERLTGEALVRLGLTG